MRVKGDGRIGINTTTPIPNRAMQILDPGSFEDGRVQIGSTGTWSAGETRGIYFGDSALTFVGEADADDRLLLMGNNSIEMRGGRVFPASNGGQDLGNNGNRWATIWGTTGNFSGNVSKGGGSFKIDHPLDPENKYLYHSFVESPDMMNIYNGNITTDAAGDAIVTMPEWFESLNTDFRYQLTVMGQFAQAIVSEKMTGNTFKIKTSLPNVEVSWQVTGVRQDAFAKKNRIPVEELKPETERGTYLHPTAFGKTEEQGVRWRQQQAEEEKLYNEKKAKAQAQGQQ
jgi:hypothetical protein